MNSRRVCILTTVHKYDDNRVYYKEVMSLNRAGLEVVYIAPDLEEGTRHGITYVKVNKPSATWKRILGFYRVFQLARKQKCRVYHFHDAELIIVGILLKMFTNAKVIYDVHEDYPSQMLTKHYLRDWMRKPLYYFMKMAEKLADRVFDAIIVADNFVFKHFSAHKTIIVYNYPDIRLFEKDNQTYKKEYDIIFPGSMAKFTAEMILQILSKAKEKGIILKCILISPFNFSGGKDWVEQRINQLSLLKEQVTLMDRIPPYDVPRYIRLSKIGLIPLPDTKKMRSNIPTKLFEYMYCGIPVITGNLPPSAQFLKNENFGFLVDPNSIDEYAEKVIQLISDESLAEEMGARGKMLVEEKYNWQTEEEKIVKLYFELLGKGSSEACGK